VLSRGDVAEWPVFGKMAELAGTIFVDRMSAHSGAVALQRMRECLREGRTVCVFPEGTTFADDEVRAFRAGAFVAAARERAAVLPVGLAYEDVTAAYGDESLGSHVRRVAGASATRVAAVIGDPIASTGLGVRPLAERARLEVERLVRRARADLGRP
jgi:1-acyl-sn-glycerol-3-phosphate acyltransferase